jgi:CTP synthase
MRLGAYRCALRAGTLSRAAYNDETVMERHRHRFELNNKFRDALIEKGMVVGGANPERDLVEIIELHDHPFFVAVQFHPEFKSKPTRPHPLFRAFIAQTLEHQGIPEHVLEQDG